MDKEIKTRSVKTLHNKDLIQRVNYLQQAANLMATENKKLSCFYGSLYKQIQKKGQLKM